MRADIRAPTSEAGGTAAVDGAASERQLLARRRCASAHCSPTNEGLLKYRFTIARKMNMSSNSPASDARQPARVASRRSDSPTCSASFGRYFNSPISTTSHDYDFREMHS